MTAYLVFDTETTGLYDKKFPDDHVSQPHLVQLGCALYDAHGREMTSADLLIAPDGWGVPPDAAKVHGITTETAAAYGIPLAVAIAVFSNMRRRATHYGGHNLEFDDAIVRIACARLSRPLPATGSKRFCTMTMGSPLTAFPPTERMKAAGFDKHKPPNLTELHRHLFGEGFAGAHSAMVDVRASARCLFEMIKRGVPIS